MEDQETTASSLTSDDNSDAQRSAASGNNRHRNGYRETHSRSSFGRYSAASASRNGQREVKERPPVAARRESGGLDRSFRSQGSGRGSLSSRGSRRGTVRVGPKLSWKSDPRASFSDWSIEIFKNGSTEPDVVYHIHRNIVGFGPRRSEFLMKEFVQRQYDVNYASNGTNNTELELPASQVDAFPMVLDFMYYTQEVKQSLTPDRACAVFKVSELLDIPALQNVIVEFFRKNVSLKNMGDFVASAEKARADRLMLVAKAKVGSLITEKPELAGLLPPKFLFDVLSIGREQLMELRTKDPKRYPKEMELSQSRHWSKAAYCCVSHNESSLTERMFDDVFSEDLLPAIDSSIALRVLALDFKLRGGGAEYTSLQRRCVQSMTEDWTKFQRGFESPEAVSDALKALPSHVLADILVKSMNK